MPRSDEIPITPEQIQKLAQLGCTQREMASVLNVSRSTLDRRLTEPAFRDALEAGDANLNVSLRRKQVELALAGDRTMLIWLGKQRLGQADKVMHASVGAEEIAGDNAAAAELANRIASVIERRREANGPKSVQ